MKTKNRFKPMLHFALENGFYISGLEETAIANDPKIILTKKLKA